MSALTWKREGADWSRRFSRVVPDDRHPGMWRSMMPGGGLSDMANLSWARNAILVAAEREIEWETRERAA